MSGLWSLTRGVLVRSVGNVEGMAEELFQNGIAGALTQLHQPNTARAGARSSLCKVNQCSVLNSAIRSSRDCVCKLKQHRLTNFLCVLSSVSVRSASLSSARSIIN